MSTRTNGNASYLTPRLEHARVQDAMRHGILSCPADAPLRDAAKTMCRHHVHAIVITDPVTHSPLGSLTDRTLLDALLDGHAEQRSLGDFAEQPLPAVSSEASLTTAAELMRDYQTAHLIVRDPASARAIGMLSTLDVAGIFAWGE